MESSTPVVSAYLTIPRLSFGKGSALAHRFYLRRVQLDCGGYDRGDVYWGHDQPGYWCGNEDNPMWETICLYFRADSREAAKAYVRGPGGFPNARFFH